MKCELLRSNMTKMPLSKIKGKLQVVMLVCTWQKNVKEGERINCRWCCSRSAHSATVTVQQVCKATNFASFFFYHNCKWCYQDERIMSPASIWKHSKHLLTQSHTHTITKTRKQVHRETETGKQTQLFSNVSPWLQFHQRILFRNRRRWWRNLKKYCCNK